MKYVKYLMWLALPILFYLCFLIILRANPAHRPFEMVVISDTPTQETHISQIWWDTGYGFNGDQTQIFSQDSGALKTLIVSNAPFAALTLRGLSKEDIKTSIGWDETLNFSLSKGMAVLKPNKKAMINLEAGGKVIYESQLSSNDILVLKYSDKNLQISKSSALPSVFYHGVNLYFSAINYHQYTKSWQISTDGTSKAYSLLFYNPDFPIYQLSGKGERLINFPKFDNPFKSYDFRTYDLLTLGALDAKEFQNKYGYLPQAALNQSPLVAAALSWALILFLALMACTNQKVRGYLQSAIYLRWFILYNAILLVLFYFFGYYNEEGYYYLDKYFIRETYFLHFTARFWHYFGGPAAYPMQWVLPYAGICTAIYYIFSKIKFPLSQWVSFCLPILMLFVPGVNLTFLSSHWRGYFGGLWWVFCSLLLFIIFYTPQKVLRIKLGILALASTLILIFQRPEFIFFYICFVPLILFKAFGVTWKKTSFLILVGLLPFPLLKSNNPLRQEEFLLIQYTYAYLHPKFYQEALFTEAQRKELKLDEPYQNSGQTVLQTIQHTFSFVDGHDIWGMGSVDHGKIAQTIKTNLMGQIKNGKFNPIPIIHSRAKTFLVALLPFKYLGSAWSAGRTITSSHVTVLKDYKVYSPVREKLLPYYRIFIAYSNTVAGHAVVYGVGLATLLSVLLTFFHWKTVPITALLNLFILIYLCFLALVNVAAGGFYYYGGYVLAVFTPLLFYLERKLREQN